MARVEVESEVTGKVWKVEVGVGDRVAEGEILVILESMKMEIPVEAPGDGTVAEIHIAQGDQVQEGDLLVTIGD